MKNHISSYLLFLICILNSCGSGLITNKPIADKLFDFPINNVCFSKLPTDKQLIKDILNEVQKHGNEGENNWNASTDSIVRASSFNFKESTFEPSISGKYEIHFSNGKIAKIVNNENELVSYSFKLIRLTENMEIFFIKAKPSQMGMNTYLNTFNHGFILCDKDNKRIIYFGFGIAHPILYNNLISLKSAMELDEYLNPIKQIVFVDKKSVYYHRIILNFRKLDYFVNYNIGTVLDLEIATVKSIYSTLDSIGDDKFSSEKNYPVAAFRNSKLPLWEYAGGIGFSKEPNGQVIRLE